MVTGKPSIARKIPSKSARCIGSSLASARSRPAVSWRHDHLPHRGEPLALEEHVLGAAEADALGAEVAAPVRVGRRVGVDPHPELPDPVGPLHEPDEVRRSAPARSSAAWPANTLPVLPSTVIQSPSASCRPLTAKRPAFSSTSSSCAPGDARLAHAAGHDGGVRRHAAARGEDRLGHHHAVEVLGRGLPPHQDHRLPRAPQLLGPVGVEHHGAAGRARATRAARW